MPAVDRPGEAQLAWLQRRIHAALTATAYGEALAAVPRLLFADAEPAENRDAAARFLALTVNQNGGSLEGVDHQLRYWCDRAGRRPAISHNQVHDLLKNVEPNLRGLEAWFSDVYQAQWAQTMAAHRQRSFTVLEIDENQRVYQGRGSKAYMSPKEFRRRATSKAAQVVTALKPGRSYASGVGYEYLVMSETVYPAQITQALATALRDPVSYDRGTEVARLLARREEFSPYPDLVMLDAGFCSYSILASLTMFCRRAKNLGSKDTAFWLPAIKSRSSREGLKLEDLSDDAMNGVYDVIMREWNKGPNRVLGTGLYYACIPRSIKDSGGLTCNLAVFYRIRKSIWNRKPKALDFEKDVRITAFFTNAGLDDANAEDLSKVYSMRWNAENLYQKLGKTLGIIPAKEPYKRVLSYGLGLAALATYGLFRVKEWEVKRAGTAEDEDAELTRQRTFFGVARRDLEQLLS